MSFINVLYDVKIYMLIMSHNGMASVKKNVGLPNLSKTVYYATIFQKVKTFGVCYDTLPSTCNKIGPAKES